jgi:hypothetical protein
VREFEDTLDSQETCQKLIEQHLSSPIVSSKAGLDFGEWCGATEGLIAHSTNQGQVPSTDHCGCAFMWKIPTMDSTIVIYQSLVHLFTTKASKLCDALLGGEDCEEQNDPVVKSRHNVDFSKQLSTQPIYGKALIVLHPKDLVGHTFLMDKEKLDNGFKFVFCGKMMLHLSYNRSMNLKNSLIKDITPIQSKQLDTRRFKSTLPFMLGMKAGRKQDW